ncbi:molybdopterin-dependent oxidoreductase [Microbacterium sp. RU33B]|uniref:molybdopterin-dependent oxidoreductase n=1 Tax=Microbacterium sp. RU33B TaxID=1907390 RepID=UPI00096997A1|nr:molybdopterin-dependent oxidoreductase [Microbacterium sp. RU33B]SIT86885.1 DMSO/TMAO reductase YedYZ, molybdopterin-dependent catalytic subunit [Microbacterium sp. RU33B]
MTDAPRSPGVVAPAAAGVAAVALGAGLGELVSGIFAPAASPFAVIGGALIDAAPSWAKDAAIALFGTADKVALLVGIGIVLLIVAGVAGWLEARKAPWGRVIVLALGAVGAVVAMTRAEASTLSWLPSVVAGVTGAAALMWLVRLVLRRGPARATPQESAAPGVAESDTPDAAPPVLSSARPDRRSFLIWSGVATGVGVAAAFAGSALRAGSRSVTVIRDVLTLPRATGTAPAVPASADFGIDGLAPVITPNADFYRIDTALIAPQIDPADWSLRIHGDVEQEVTLTWDELVALPLGESVTTLACVSNPVGGDLIGTAVWLGYPIRELLARAKPTADADMVLSRSIDGFTASTPLDVLTDERDAVLAIGMNGQPLPIEHGFPVRMVVPGLYGYVSATKWVTELEVTRFDKATAYWTDRGWSEEGPVKLQSRIDVPRGRQSVPAGETVIAGVAWQQHVGVSGVEVQIDEGAWQQAELATPISDDTWVQWRFVWDAVPGDHTVRSRATSRTGEVQTDVQRAVVPSGATGHHEITISVS